MTISDFKESLYQTIRAVGECIRSGRSQNRVAAVRVIEAARLQGLINENEASAYCSLLSGCDVWEPKL